MSGNSRSESTGPIDAVIAWVDGSDPRLAEKRNRYLPGQGKNTHPGAHPTRFASVNEIRYCVLSIFRFAPFIRNLYIITDGQDPGLQEDIRTLFPERMNSVRIVDHKEIFEGFEQYLPTFNSISIGNMIWRIKGLSENFIYFNDDTFLIRSTRPEDWFMGDKPVLRGKWVPAPLYRIMWLSIRKAFYMLLLHKKEYQPRASFHMGQWNSASLAGFRFRYFTNSHTPHTVNRKVIEDFFSHNQSSLEKNISFRFRSYSQFTFIALSNHLQLSQGNRHISAPDIAYLKPFNRSGDYIDKKIKYCTANQNIKFMCVQSLEMCPKEDMAKVFGWLEGIMQLPAVISAANKDI